MDEHRDETGRERRLEELEERLERLEGRRSTADRSRSAVNTLIPEDARQHIRAAGREQLLAVRSLLDHWIGRLREDERSDKPDSGRENIRIE